MAATITVQEAEHNFAQILERLKAGEEEIIIAQDETPVARLVSVALPDSDPKTSGRRISGYDKGKVFMSDDFDDPLPELEKAFAGEE